MTLYDLGYKDWIQEYRMEQNLDSFGIGRIISEHKERYVVKTEAQELEGELIGNLRFSATSRADFPAVGDWVAISEYDKDKAVIHAIYPRASILERQAVGKLGEKQIIATNIDIGLIVQAVDRDFNINRIERYLTICYASNVKPIIILNKTDLLENDEVNSILNSVKERLKGVETLAISNTSKSGYAELMDLFKKGKTYCLLGSSGVGKSTLMNNISGKAQMKTNSISTSTNKGRHVTSHRELVVLKNGGVLIDNPGMREVGIADAGYGMEKTFGSIVEHGLNCRFKDCTHMHEKGCAVIEAVDQGIIDSASYENYLKMEKEKNFFESSAEDKKKKDKDLGKLIKNMKKNRNFDKY